MYETLTLYEDTEFLVSQCSTCKKICVYFQQVILGFDEEQFTDWYLCFFTSEFEQRAYQFPNYQLKVIIDTPSYDAQLAFNKTQYLQLKNGIEQALHYIEVITLINEGI